MSLILFRCDASHSMGSGHVMRCRTLARQLHKRGADVTFLCRRQSGDLIALLEQEFPVLILPEQPLSADDGLVGRDLYAAWLGCTQEQDAAHCLQSLAEFDITSPSWLVVDHYGLDACWQLKLLAGIVTSDANPKLLVIDDLADRFHQADLLLDQNFFGAVTQQRYQNLVPAQCQKLLGPSYALLGPEYAQLHPLIPCRTELRRVLVFFGGVDPLNFTVRALEALMDPLFADLAVDVVIGRQSLHSKEVEELVAKRFNTTLHVSLPSLAGLIARADLALGAGGANTWERACLGLPSIVIALAENQLPFTEALDELGCVHFLGQGLSVTSERIKSALSDNLGQRIQGFTMNLDVDGYGANRVASKVVEGC